MSSLELSFGKKFSAVFLENPFIRKVLIAETAFFTDFMLVRSDLHCVFETGKKDFYICVQINVKCARRESWKLNHNIPMLTQRCRCQSWGNYDLKVQSCFSQFWRQDFVLLQVKNVSRKSNTGIRALARMRHQFRV